jgi:hypothetical protein
MTSVECLVEGGEGHHVNRVAETVDTCVKAARCLLSYEKKMKLIQFVNSNLKRPLGRLISNFFIHVLCHDCYVRYRIYLERLL